MMPPGVKQVAATGAAPIAGTRVPPEVFERLRLRVFERGWLSSNNVLFCGADGEAAIVDTGYGLHSEQTVALVAATIGHATLGLIANTHLHSDHCGGNAMLQRRWPQVRTLVPAGCAEAAREWDARRLTFVATDQRCERFRVDATLQPGGTLALGAHAWEVHAAPGHDPTAVMLFEPATRTLISADALWERRLAIVFPELVGESGFDACLRTLDHIERLAPSTVIPGHGRPFTDVAAALAASRERVAAFAAEPAKHRRHAIRSLVMFHMLESRRCGVTELQDWLLRTPIVAAGQGEVGGEQQRRRWAREMIDSLIADGALTLVAPNMVGLPAL